MKRRTLLRAGTWSIIAMAVGWSLLCVAAETALDTAKIEQLTGVKGDMNTQEGVFKVSAPRTDLAVTAAGVKLTPPMGLTSWAAFHKAGDQTMVMGDMVLLEDQVNPVMSVALTNGLEVTALHNHFFWDTPKVMFMHIGGMGTEETLAAPWAKCSPRSRRPVGGKAPSRMRSLTPPRPPWIPSLLRTSSA